MPTGVWDPLTTEYGIPIFEPWYCPEPKSACMPMAGPMKLMIALEFESTGEPEISWFHRLSPPKGRNPLRLAPCPVLIALHALWVAPEPDPPEPEPLPPDPLPEPFPPLPKPPP